MKIAGINPADLSQEYVLVLPRANGQIVIRAKPIHDYAEFNLLCPPPTPPSVTTKDGAMSNTADPSYLEMLRHYEDRRSAWVVIKSLEPSQIEWEQVQLDNPGSWVNWEKDFKAANFNYHELHRIAHLVLEANSLDERKLEAARKVFQLGQ